MPRGRYWTTKEEEILVSFANCGADYVSKMLKSELGSVRTRSAVISHANQIGISLAVYEICPTCSRPVKKGQVGKFTGMCRVCNEKYIAEESRRLRDLAERPYTAEEEAVIARYRTIRAKERKRKQRALDKSRDLQEAVEFFANSKAN